MIKKSPLRQRTVPATPFKLTVEDPTETFELHFRLAIDLNALCLIEIKTGINMLTGVGELFGNPSISTISVLFWAALQTYHPEYDGEVGLAAVRNLLTIGSAKDALTACVEAFLTQLPKEQAEKIRAEMKKEEEGVPAEAPLVKAPTEA